MFSAHASVLAREASAQAGQERLYHKTQAGEALALDWKVCTTGFLIGWKGQVTCMVLPDSVLENREKIKSQASFFSEK